MLKKLIATPGEIAAARVLKLWRIRSDVREELWDAILWDAIKVEVERAIANDRRKRQ